MLKKRLKIILQFNNFIFKKINQTYQQQFCTNTTNEDNYFPPIDMNNIMTMTDVRDQIMNNLGLCPRHYDPSPQPRDYLLQYEPKYKDLPVRTMRDSFTRAIIPLSKVLKLQRKYISQNPEHIRVGRLMEDMDLFAVWICHKHLHIPKLDPKIPLPYTFVTVLVDQTNINAYRSHYNKDIILSGHASWVGRSAIEITVWLDEIDEEKKCKRLIRSLFLMAARNATNTNAAPVNPLQPINDYEQEMFENGIKHKEQRIETFKTTSLTTVPNLLEQELIHHIFMKTINKDSMCLNQYELPNKSYTLMENTKILQTTPCFPQKLNVQNTVFGGYLMRIACETSLICAHKFCGKFPNLIRICEILFRKPIYVSSYIEMTSHVIYANCGKMQILTTADVLTFDTSNNYTNKTETTNIFQFTFDSMDNEDPRRIIPRTYKEAMWFLDGRRKLHLGLNLDNDEE